MLADHGGAIADCTEALKIDPKNVHALASRAGSKGKLRDHHGAVADSTEALKIEPTDLDALGDG